MSVISFGPEFREALNFGLGPDEKSKRSLGESGHYLFKRGRGGGEAGFEAPDKLRAAQSAPAEVSYEPPTPRQTSDSYADDDEDESDSVNGVFEDDDIPMVEAEMNHFMGIRDKELTFTSDGREHRIVISFGGSEPLIKIDNHPGLALRNDQAQTLLSELMNMVVEEIVSINANLGAPPGGSALSYSITNALPTDLKDAVQIAKLTFNIIVGRTRRERVIGLFILTTFITTCYFNPQVAAGKQFAFERFSKVVQSNAGNLSVKLQDALLKIFAVDPGAQKACGIFLRDVQNFAGDHWGDLLGASASLIGFRKTFNFFIDVCIGGVFENSSGNPAPPILTLPPTVPESLALPSGRPRAASPRRRETGPSPSARKKHPCGDEPIEWVAVGRTGRKYCVDAKGLKWNDAGQRVNGFGSLM
jgi:hypothetical protein